MKETYQITIIDGVPVIEVEGNKVLVDTGCPLTFGNVGNLEIMGRERSIHETLDGYINVNHIAELVGENIDVMMGRDILADYCVSWDYKKGEMMFCDEACEEMNGALEILRPGMFTKQVGVLVEMNVAGNNLMTIIDTGARISYLMPEFNEGQAAVRVEEDYNPMYGGVFRTNIYNLNTRIGDLEKTMEYGDMPEGCKRDLSMVNVQAVIGRDLFEAAKVTIDFISGKVYIQKY